MKVEISESTYQAIAAVNADVSAFLEAAARERLRRSCSAEPADPASIVARFRRHRGILRNTTIDEIVADRRRGLL